MAEPNTLEGEMFQALELWLSAELHHPASEPVVDVLYPEWFEQISAITLSIPHDIDETRSVVDKDSTWGKVAGAVADFCQEKKPADPSQLLRQAALAAELAHQLECQQLEAAYAWILLNPPLPPSEIITGAEDTPIIAGGPGAPVYRGGASDIFAVATGKSVRFSDNQMRRAGELIGRFPLTWHQIKQHHIPLWRAWALVRKTVELPLEVATFLDAELAPRFRDVSPAQLDRAIAAAWAAVAPDHMQQVAQEDLDQRGVWIDRQNTAAGTCRIYGELDAPDALSFDEFLTNAAKTLIEEGLSDRMPQARALALGMLSRGELQAAPIPKENGVLTIAPTNLQLYVHFSRDQLSHHLDNLSPSADHLAPETVTPASLTSGSVSSGVASVEGLASPVLLAQVQRWCGKDSASVRVTPVIDLEDSYSTGSYTPTHRLREQVILRDWTCVFPTCTRRARACDIDHIIAHARGGCTCTENLAALCRRHHRAKTRNQWNYMAVGDEYLWECLKIYINAKYVRKRKERPTWWLPPQAPPPDSEPGIPIPQPNPEQSDADPPF